MNRVPPQRRTLAGWLLVPALLLAGCSAGAGATTASPSIGSTATISPAGVPSSAPSAMPPASVAPQTAIPETVAPGTPAPATPRPTVRPVPPPTRSPAPPRITPAPSPAATKVTIDEAANGQTVTVHVGTLVTLDLHSTYWQVDGTSNAAVLAPASAPTVAPASPGTCVPGGGCGTVVAVFHAIAPGRATVTAARTTCGEALLCTGSAGAFNVTVVVER